MKIKSLFITFLTSFLIFSCNCKTDKASKTTQQKTSQSQVIQKIAKFKDAGFEIIDYHAHLKGGLTMEELLDHSKKTGIELSMLAWGFLLPMTLPYWLTMSSIKSIPCLWPCRPRAENG